MCLVGYSGIGINQGILDLRIKMIMRKYNGFVAKELLIAFKLEVKSWIIFGENQ